QVKEITLNSSPYGKNFYLHLGFVPLSEEQEIDGIRFTPMKYAI
ncbi:MAG: GNAT family N-acetyltransferase, partial [Clostridia bacterium]|nr:GNAT family N-acetyltransferase [Clostridia bacterium]